MCSSKNHLRRLFKINILPRYNEPFRNNSTLPSNDHKGLKIHEEVRSALFHGKPVVGLESTIITHGMPYPENIQCALDVENQVRKFGAIPATVSIVDGEIQVGTTQEQLTRLGDVKNSLPVKASRRDLAYVACNKLNGGTTVSATMLIINKAGINIMATGGIGGVHRGYENTLDASADLTELGRSGVAVVCSGVKSILDIPRTLEYLETQGVFVATLGDTDQFPAFFSRSSGCRSPYKVTTALQAAEIIHKNTMLDLKSGMLFAVPVPEEYGIDQKVMEDAINAALVAAEKASVTGKHITPFLLAEIEKITGGRSLETNIALIKNNAGRAAEIAVEYSKLKEKTRSLEDESSEESAVPVVPVPPV